MAKSKKSLTTSKSATKSCKQVVSERRGKEAAQSKCPVLRKRLMLNLTSSMMS